MQACERHAAPTRPNAAEFTEAFMAETVADEVLADQFSWINAKGWVARSRSPGGVLSESTRSRGGRDSAELPRGSAWHPGRVVESQVHRKHCCVGTRHLVG